MLPVFVILFLVFLGLFLGVAIFGALYDRISEFEIFKSRTWLEVRTPFIVVTVVVLLASVIVATSRAAKKREKAEEDFARTQGWVYTRSYEDPEGRTGAVRAALEKVAPEKRFSVGNSVAVESGPLSIVLFHCRHNERDWVAGKDYPGFGCLVQSNRFESAGPQVTILRRYGTDAGESRFARSFIVKCRDPEWERHIVKESLQSLLLEQWREDAIYSEIIIGPGGAVIRTRPDPSVGTWPALIELARRIESTLE